MDSIGGYFLARTRVYRDLLLLCTVHLTVYTVQLAQTNASRGFQPISLDVTYLSLLAASVLITGALLPSRIRQPADFFTLVYGLLVVVSFAVFHPAFRRLEPLEYAGHFAIVLAPLVVHQVVVQLAPALRLPRVLDARSVEWLIVLACFAGAVVALVNAPSSAGWDPDTTGQRRFEGREIFAAGSAMAYLVAMMTNGFLPFLAFIAGLRRHTVYLLIAISVAVLMYYVLGNKAQFAYIGFAYFIGYGLRTRKELRYHRLIWSLLTVTFVAWAIERQFWDVALTGEYFFRRAFVVPAHVVASYFDLLFGDTHLLWSASSGLSVPEGVTYLVGELYFGRATANVDTNAYVYALASGGALGYVGAVILTSTIFALLNAGYRGSGNRAFLYLGFAYAILLVEQSATTALLTSGIGPLGVLVGLAARGWRGDRSAAAKARRLGHPAPA